MQMADLKEVVLSYLGDYEEWLDDVIRNSEHFTYDDTDEILQDLYRSMLRVDKKYNSLIEKVEDIELENYLKYAVETNIIFADWYDDNIISSADNDNNYEMAHILFNTIAHKCNVNPYKLEELNRGISELGYPYKIIEVDYDGYCDLYKVERV